MARREDIIKAARQVALESGIDQVSVRRVAARAGIGASTLRYYFPTSKDLFDALVGTEIGDLLTDEGLGDTSVPAVDRLTSLFGQFLPLQDSQVGHLEALLTLYQLAFESGKLVGSQTLRDTTQAGEDTVTMWLETLQGQGEKLALGPREGARFLLVVVNGLALDMIARAPETHATEVQSQLRNAVSLLLA